jgi:5-methylcytosine-specific restriction endonuclease McrA
MKPHKALGLCATCYIKTYHYDEAKAFNIMKWHNISLELYREITKKCLICGFDKAIHLHHLDKNHNNSSRENLIGLCPNHHEMIHMYEYEKELTKEVQNALAVLPS